MLKIKKNTSAAISLALAYIALLGRVAVAATLPFIVEHYITYLNTAYMKRYIPALIVIYSALIPVGVADVLLILLLKKVKRAQVFTSAAVALLRGISWCCFAECLILATVGNLLFAPFAPIITSVAAVAAFLGIVLRVVKNVIEEATAIKAENDFTI